MYTYIIKKRIIVLILCIFLRTNGSTIINNNEYIVT